MTATAVDHAPVAPLRTRATSLQLTWIEGLRLVRHPIFLAGLLLSIGLGLELGGQTEVGGAYLALIGVAAIPLALATLVVANLAALRSRRSDTGELYGSLPAPERARTLAHLLSVVFASAVCCLAVVAGFLVYETQGGLQVTRAGETAVPSLAELAQGPVVVALLGAVGVALARWLPYLPVAPLAGIAILWIEIPWWNLQSGYVWFAPVVNPARTGPHSSWPCDYDQDWPCVLERLASGEMAWHLLYLAGLIVTACALALARERPRKRAALAAAGGISVAVVAGILQLP